MKTRIKERNFLLSLDEHSVYYSNEKQLLCACFFFSWQLGLISSTIKVLKWVLHRLKYVMEDLRKMNSQNSQTTKVLRHSKNITPIKLITKYCIHVFCIRYSVGWNIFYLYTLYIEQHIKTYINIQYRAPRGLGDLGRKAIYFQWAEALVILLSDLGSKLIFLGI